MDENISYEDILQRMLDRVPGTLDKREGSIIYDALAPAAMEFMAMYLEKKRIMDETYADTASREYLIKRTGERGIYPYPATNTILKAEVTPINVNVPIGSRFSLDKLNYIITEKIKDGEYKLQCETKGVVGNTYFGNLIPIDYIDGLETIKITELLIPGEDEEDTEAFRQRFFDTFDSQAFGGNKADYKEKVNAIKGVGGVKVYPVWNGGGTVKLTIISSNFEKPSETLINNVQTAIDPIQNQGQGDGIAPIGHVVTVFGCGETTVDITTKIVFQNDWTWEDLKPYAEKAVDDYFKELSSKWENEEHIIVRISQIENRFLNLTGVLDISDTELNGQNQNIFIEADNIPKRGVVTNAE